MVKQSGNKYLIKYINLIIYISKEERLTINKAALKKNEGINSKKAK